jgi:hypothetical protein
MRHLIPFVLATTTPAKHRGEGAMFGRKKNNIVYEIPKKELGVLLGIRLSLTVLDAQYIAQLKQIMDREKIPTEGVEFDLNRGAFVRSRSE